jgi:hypothetical protein
MKLFDFKVKIVLTSRGHIGLVYESLYSLNPTQQ